MNSKGWKRGEWIKKGESVEQTRGEGEGGTVDHPGEKWDDIGNRPRSACQRTTWRRLRNLHFVRD